MAQEPINVGDPGYDPLYRFGFGLAHLTEHSTGVRSGGVAALRVSGPVLPDGEPRDLYVVDGRVTLEPQAGAETVASGWVVPGLVDAHCHLGLDEHGEVDRRGDRGSRRSRTATRARCCSATAGVPPTPAGSRTATTCPG